MIDVVIVDPIQMDLISKTNIFIEWLWQEGPKQRKSYITINT
jgi:hypothetical protein